MRILDIISEGPASSDHMGSELISSHNSRFLLQSRFAGTLGYLVKGCSSGGMSSVAGPSLLSPNILIWSPTADDWKLLGFRFVFFSAFKGGMIPSLHPWSLHSYPEYNLRVASSCLKISPPPTPLGGSEMLMKSRELWSK